MTTPQLSPFDALHCPPLPTDAITRDHAIAARDRIREASDYLARMVGKFGANHPDTAHAQQQLDDANHAAAQLGAVAPCTHGPVDLSLPREQCPACHMHCNKAVTR